MAPQERIPRTVRGWSKEITQNGVSSRPAPDRSDLIDPNYNDPEGIKPERTLLAGIISIRAYQRTRDSLLSLESVPLTTPLDVQELGKKSERVGKIFIKKMTRAVLEDEQEVKTSENYPALAVYQRLEDIISPAVNKAFPGGIKQMPIITTGDLIDNPSQAFIDVIGGVEPLALNTKRLIIGGFYEYQNKFKRTPSNKELFEIAKNSYDSYILYLAALHKGDGSIIDLIQTQLGPTFNPVQLNDNNTLGVNPEIVALIKDYQAKERQNRSQTARCAFLIDPNSVAKFLDEPAEFTDPLKDAFENMIKVIFE